MNTKRYYIMTGIMILIVTPLAIDLTALLTILFVTIDLTVISVLCTVLSIFFFWYIYVKKTELPVKASELFLPVIAGHIYFMVVWLIANGMAGYRYDRDLVTFIVLTLPYFVFHFAFSFIGDYSFFPILNTAVTAVIVMTMIISCRLTKKKILPDKKIILYIFIFIVLTGIAVFQYYDRKAKFLPSDYQTERIDSEVAVEKYHPFEKENELAGLDEPPAVTFDNAYPVLDGATAAYPVYAAIVQELYLGLDEESVEQYVFCSKTDKAYERLINGEIDIFFGAQPSKQQMKAAEDKGVVFEMTPIGREAFVIFVNQDNPVENLTISQIQDIYQKKITNWKACGGKDEKILPFQRPVDSGSQTIMQAKVMGDKPLPDPLLEEYQKGMGGVISGVAKYRNYSSAIGYSFRYFTTGMNPNENIKLLSVDGIAPTTQNIRNETYPFTIDVYAVTAGTANKNADKLIQWILSDQGQSLIEACGYVRK